MANYLNLPAYTALQFGPQVIKKSVALANNTTSALFTVATGNVLVTSLYGTIAATAPTGTLSLGITPTTGSTANTGIATATTVSSHEVGTWVAPTASSGTAGALVVGANAAGAVYNPSPFVVPTGTITQTTNANLSSGTVSWYLTYVPLDPGANVT